MDNAIFLLKSLDYGEAMICSECRTLLTYKKDVFGFSGYIHANDDMQGDYPDTFHIPDPVPMRESVEFDCLCDFCSTLHPVHVLGDVLAEEFEYTIENLTVNYNTEWSACPTCYNLISEDKWDIMTDRAIDLTIQTFGETIFDEDSRNFARHLHDRVREGFIGMVSPKENTNASTKESPS